MSNNEQLFAEIIPSEEATLSGGNGGHRRGGHRPRIKVTADASATVIGDTERTIVRTTSDAYIDENRVLARASTIVRAVL